MKEIKINKGLNYIHLISGGLDSTYKLMALLKDIHEDKISKAIVTPVFFDYGHYAAQAEYESVKKVVNKVKEEFDTMSILEEPIKISLKSDLFLWCKNVAFTGIEVGDKDGEIQNRNMVLFSILASYLFACAENQGINEANFEIYSGFKEKEMSDCNQAFFDKISALLLTHKAKYNISLKVLPASTWKQIKNEIIRLYKGQGNKFNEIEDIIISCYSPKNGKACGSCCKCKFIAKQKNL